MITDNPFWSAVWEGVGYITFVSAIACLFTGFFAWYVGNDKLGKRVTVGLIVCLLPALLLEPVDKDSYLTQFKTDGQGRETAHLLQSFDRTTVFWFNEHRKLTSAPDVVLIREVDLKELSAVFWMTVDVISTNSRLHSLKYTVEVGLGSSLEDLVLAKNTLGMTLDQLKRASTPKVRRWVSLEIRKNVISHLREFNAKEPGLQNLYDPLNPEQQAQFKNAFYEFFAKKFNAQGFKVEVSDFGLI